MKICYENDAQRGAGNGILRCADDIFGEGAVTFVLQRASDRLFLSEQGWVPQGSSLQPAAQQREGDTLLLFIGAGVVNQLDTQESYRCTLHTAEGQTLTAALRVQDVLFGPEAPRSNAVTMPPPVRAVQPEPTPAPQPEAQPEPQPTPLPELDRLDDTPAVQKKSSLPLLLGVGLLLLALAGAGAWWFLRTPPPPPSHTTAQPEQKPAESKPAPDKAAPANAENKTAAEKPAMGATPPNAPAQPAPAAASGAAQRVTLFFGGQERTPQAAAQLSRELPKATPVEQDAVYRLYYFAGENGETSVLMDYAACLDPALPRWGSINKDAPSAWAIYEKAKAAGDANAAAAQVTLKAWLTKQAAGGDTQADLWLKQLP